MPSISSDIYSNPKVISNPLSVNSSLPAQENRYSGQKKHTTATNDKIFIRSLPVTFLLPDVRSAFSSPVCTLSFEETASPFFSGVGVNVLLLVHLIFHFISVLFKDRVELLRHLHKEGAQIDPPLFQRYFLEIVPRLWEQGASFCFPLQAP